MQEDGTTEEELKNTRIRPEEIIHLVDEVSRRSEAGYEVSWIMQIAIMAEKFPGDLSKGVVIMQHLQCMIALVDDPRMKGWSFEPKEEPGCLLAREAVFRATALAPIHITNEQAHFDADEFFALALSETPSQGTI
jgi:hypothetical protein